YQKNWDPLRGRYVGAFSWTEFDTLPTPTGEQWLQAWEVAEAVYYNRQPHVLDGAMFFHATYIKPDWAKTKKPIAKIGGRGSYPQGVTPPSPRRRGSPAASPPRLPSSAPPSPP